MLCRDGLSIGSTVLGIQIGLVGLEAGIGGHPVLFRRERMNDARFESGPGESPFGRQMVIPGSLHNDNRILYVVPRIVVPGLKVRVENRRDKAKHLQLHAPPVVHVATALRQVHHIGSIHPFSTTQIAGGYRIQQCLCEVSIVDNDAGLRIVVLGSFVEIVGANECRIVDDPALCVQDFRPLKLMQLDALVDHAAFLVGESCLCDNLVC